MANDFTKKISTKIFTREELGLPKEGFVVSFEPLSPQSPPIAITQSEYNQIVELLGRTPSPLELGIFGSLWSEHCGYKHSKPLLKIFKNNHPTIVSTPVAFAYVAACRFLGPLPA